MGVQLVKILMTLNDRKAPSLLYRFFFGSLCIGPILTVTKP